MSYEDEAAYLFAQERLQDITWVTSLLKKYPNGGPYSEEDEAELKACEIRQLMRRDAGYR